MDSNARLAKGGMQVILLSSKHGRVRCVLYYCHLRLLIRYCITAMHILALLVVAVHGGLLDVEVSGHEVPQLCGLERLPRSARAGL